MNFEARRIPWVYLMFVPVAILSALFSSRLVRGDWDWGAALSNGMFIAGAMIVGTAIGRRRRDGPSRPRS
jgi:branched-subunit amino acid transport protein